jgi:hypothetical protein
VGQLPRRLAGDDGALLIVSLYADRDPDDYWEAADGRLAAMVQARSDLPAGDPKDKEHA